MPEEMDMNKLHTAPISGIPTSHRTGLLENPEHERRRLHSAVGEAWQEFEDILSKELSRTREAGMARTGREKLLDRWAVKEREGKIRLMREMVNEFERACLTQDEENGDIRSLGRSLGRVYAAKKGFEEACFDLGIVYQRRPVFRFPDVQAVLVLQQVRMARAMEMIDYRWRKNSDEMEELRREIRRRDILDEWGGEVDDGYGGREGESFPCLPAYLLFR